MEGWIKLYRRITQWEWWGDTPVVVTWIYLLSRAEYKPTKWRGIQISKGQILTSTRELSANIGLSHQQVRTALAKLKNSNAITSILTHNRNLITICNYDRYQGEEESDQHTLTQRKSHTNKQTFNTKVNTPSNTVLTSKSTNINADLQQTNNTQVTNLKSCELETYKEKKKTGNGLATNGATTDETRDPTPNIYKEYKEEKNNNISSSSPARERTFHARTRKTDSILEFLKGTGMEWKETMCMQLRITLPELDELFEDYARELVCQGVEEKEEKDIKRHFANMARIVLKKRKEEQNGTNRIKTKADRDREFAIHIQDQLSNPTTVESGNLENVW